VFAAFAKSHGVDVPDFAYTQTQTSLTTIRYALDSMCAPLDRNFRQSPHWESAVNDVYLKHKAYVDNSRMSSSEILQDLNNSSSMGYPHVYNGCPTVEIFKQLNPNIELVQWAQDWCDNTIQWSVAMATMKKELVPKLKLIRRKQRMFVIQPKQGYVLHKHYYGKQSKSLRNRHESAHGTSWFFGAVHLLATQLENSTVDSYDFEFWDKRFVVMEDIYRIRNQWLAMSGDHSPDDVHYISKVNASYRNILIITQTGDVFIVSDRINPSGFDATTENNVLAHDIITHFLYRKHCFETAVNPFTAKIFTLDRYNGDDELKSSKSYCKDFLDYYMANVHQACLKIKEHIRTEGPIGAKFSGFTIVKPQGSNYYMPKYEIEKVWVGLLLTHDSDYNITVSRFLAFAFLLYPHTETFKQLRPVAIKYLRSFEGKVNEGALQAALDFWQDEEFLRRSWTGLEAGSCSIRPDFTPWEEEEYCENNVSSGSSHIGARISSSPQS